MHIDDQEYQRAGKTYRRTLLRNSYRKDGKICHDTIANLSKCSEEEIDALKFALKNKALIANKQIPESDVKTRQGLSVGAVWLLHKVAKGLGIPKALGKGREAGLAMWLVISVVIGCVSRLSAVRLARSHAACDILGLDSFCEDDLYQTLDWLSEQQFSIEDHLFKCRFQNKIPNLFLYDVTSSYFEGDKNELAAYGYNRDKKKGKKQIVIGLLTDDEGYPVSCEVFEGNTKDMATFKSQVEKMANRFGIKDVTFVGDRGMIKSVQIEDLSAEDFFYITALTKPQIEKMIKDGIFQMELFEKTICEVEHNNIRYVLRCNPVRTMEIRETRHSKLLSLERLCKKKSRYLLEHPRAKVTAAKKEILNFAEKLKIDTWAKVVPDQRSLSIEVNKAELAKAEKLDGCYAITSNISSDNASKETIHARYKDLAGVEWAFRTMKTTLLHLRGIYVRKANRTRAHVFTIMLAYMLAYELRRLWQDMEVTIEEGIEELSSVCATEVIMGDVTIQTVPIPRELGGQLLQKANVTLPDAIPCKGVRVHTRKHLVDERVNHANSKY
jgi:transposase